MRKELFPKSLKKRMVLSLVFCTIVPVLLIEGVMLYQMFTLNQSSVDTAVRHELNTTADGLQSLMDNMNSMSQQLASDGNIGQNLYLYFEEGNSSKKAELFNYLKDQIANYEAANPNIANITYFYQPGQSVPSKINQSSLARRRLPDENLTFSHQALNTYYGPHSTASVAASYPVLSLLRKYEMSYDYGDVYIYIESGFRKLENLIPREIQGMSAVFLMVSDEGRTVYSSDSARFPLFETTGDFPARYRRGGANYVTYLAEGRAHWQLRLLIPESEYYRHVYHLIFNFSVITLAAAAASLLLSVRVWNSIYRPFRRFDHTLKRIAADDDVESGVEQMNIEEFDRSFAYFKKLKERILTLLQRVQMEEKKRSRLEIKALIGKMNPHFLHNTLDTLKWYADGKGYKDIVSFIVSLNKLLMYNMEKIRSSTLESELGAIRDYIVLQQLKYDLDFGIRLDLPRQMLRADLPRFVLQPIVENAILHGGASPCVIRVEAVLLSSGKLAVRVKNNGKALDCGRMAHLLAAEDDRSSNGIGLQYVARMLRERFGGQAELRFDRLEDGMNQVELIFPFEVENFSPAKPAEEDGK